MSCRRQRRCPRFSCSRPIPKCLALRSSPWRLRWYVITPAPSPSEAKGIVRRPVSSARGEESESKLVMMWVSMVESFEKGLHAHRRPRDPHPIATNMTTKRALFP
jgi:hypothetical protein